MKKNINEQSPLFRSWLFWLRGEDTDTTDRDNETDAASATKAKDEDITGGAVHSISLHEPDSFGEAKEITRLLKTETICIVSLFRVPSGFRQRVLDFLCGVIYGLDGTVEKLDEGLILFAPKTVVVSGKITDIRNHTSFQNNLQHER